MPKPVDLNQLLELLAEHLPLQWIYENTTTARKKSQEEETQKVPSPEQAETLFDLILMGDIRGIVEYATEMEQQDAQLQHFTKEVCQLAKSFQEPKLEVLVKQYMKD